MLRRTRGGAGSGVLWFGPSLNFMLNTYKLACTATTPASNMTSVQLPRKGVIKQILMNLSCVLETDSVLHCQVALNRAVVSMGTSVNTPTNILAELHSVALITTSGISNATNVVCVPLNVPIVEKDTLYLHGSATGGTNGADVDVVIFVEET